MVSLLSFFSGKKRARRAPSPPRQTINSSSSTGALATNDAASGMPNAPNRFLSLRHKSTSKPYDISKRRTSSEVSRKRSQRQVPRSHTSELPRLALGWELPANGTAGRDSLGLDGIGRIPKLTASELEILRKQRYQCDEIMQGWKVFGKALKDTGLHHKGIMMPRRPQDSRHQEFLLSLFLLTIHPELAKSFPSVTGHYPSSPSDISKPIWSDRFQVVITEITDPSDLAESLKYLLRRIVSSTSVNVSKARPLLDTGVYKQFVEEERRGGFSSDAYEKLFLPRVGHSVGSCVEEIFETWAAISAHADKNNMSGGRISRLLGWWILDISSMSVSLSWRELYDGWNAAGRRVEHLFYAWIRQQLPTRLLELVSDYPYGDVSDTADSLPAPPPSTFSRLTLHISITSELSVLKPADILDSLLSAKTEPHFPLWNQIIGDRSSTKLNSGDLLAEESMSFLRGTSCISGKAEDSNKSSALLETPVTSEPAMYRPFSLVSGRSSSPQHTRPHLTKQDSTSADQSVTSNGILNEPIFGESTSPFRSPSPSIHRESHPTSRPLFDRLDTAAWESFKHSGFGEVSNSDLALSPKIPLPSPSLETPRARVSFDGKSSPVPVYTNRPSKQCKIEGEMVIELDDLFMAFCEDAQSDSFISSEWPVFVVARLKKPVVIEEEKKIEWLLVNVDHSTPPAPATETRQDERPTSPSTSNFSRAGSSFSLFRRSTSQGGKSGPRRSLFSSSRRASANQLTSSSVLPALSEARSTTSQPSQTAEPISALSEAPTEYTITEMGEMVKIPPSTSESKSEQMEPSLDTAPTEWQYRAEGAAHIIFGYQGMSPTYMGKILRIRKTSMDADTKDESGKVWREELLPRLVPPSLLLSPKDVSLEAEWAKSVLHAAESTRPEARKRSSGLLTDALNGDVKGSVMEDLIAASPVRGEAVLCIEIKPKWGFLPSANNITPAEAVPIKSQISRYRLHQYFRDPENAFNDQYDPLDLFSSDDERMKLALEALWGIWGISEGSKNNWRVYVDGKVIKPNDSGFIPTTSENGTLAMRTSSFILPALHATGILSKLKDLQSSLDPIDISSLARRFREEHPKSEVFDASIITDPTVPELREFVDRYLSSSGYESVAETWSLREHMISYALSAIFKDCSIFIRMPLIKENGTYRAKAGATAKIIDLDLKPIGALRKWYELDESIWHHWLSIHPQTALELTEALKSKKAQLETLPITAECPSTRAIFSATPKTSVPTTPTRSSVAQQSSLPAGGFEALSLVDALTILPNRNTFGRADDAEQHDDTPRQSIEVVNINDALALTPSKPSVNSHQGNDGRTTIADPTLFDPLEEPGLASDERSLQLPADEAEPLHATGESPLIFRRSRSAAPSPSPHPELADLPSDRDVDHDEVVPEKTAANIVPALFLGAPISTAQQTRDSGEEEQEISPATVKAPTDNIATTGLANTGLETAASGQKVTENRPQTVSSEHAFDHQVNEEQQELLLDDPAASVPMEKGDSDQSTETPYVTSGKSTPFEEFSTPMGDISEPVLLAATGEDSVSSEPQESGENAVSGSRLNPEALISHDKQADTHPTIAEKGAAADFGDEDQPTAIQEPLIELNLGDPHRDENVENSAEETGPGDQTFGKIEKDDLAQAPLSDKTPMIVDEAESQSYTGLGEGDQRPDSNVEAITNMINDPATKGLLEPQSLEPHSLETIPENSAIELGDIITTAGTTRSTISCEAEADTAPEQPEQADTLKPVHLESQVALPDPAHIAPHSDPHPGAPTEDHMYESSAPDGSGTLPHIDDAMSAEVPDATTSQPPRTFTSQSPSERSTHEPDTDEEQLREASPPPAVDHPQDTLGPAGTEPRAPRPSESAELLKSYEAEDVDPDTRVIAKSATLDVQEPSAVQDVSTASVRPAGDNAISSRQLVPDSSEGAPSSIEDKVEGEQVDDEDHQQNGPPSNLVDDSQTEETSLRSSIEPLGQTQETAEINGASAFERDLQSAETLTEPSDPEAGRPTTTLGEVTEPLPPSPDDHVTSTKGTLSSVSAETESQHSPAKEDILPSRADQ